MRTGTALRAGTAVLAGLLAAAGLTACSGSDPEPGTLSPSPSPSPSPSSSTASASPSATTPEQQIEAAVRTYYAELLNGAVVLEDVVGRHDVLNFRRGGSGSRPRHLHR